MNVYASLFRALTFALLLAIILPTCQLVAPPVETPSTSNVPRLIFVSDQDGNLEIYAMDANGAGQTNLTKNKADDWGASWSPNGQKIVFTTARGGSASIYIMNADGSGQKRLLGATNAHPDWSPDGTKIAYVCGENAASYEICVMDADGSNRVQLTQRGGNKSFPAWSPDGQYIAYGCRFGRNAEVCLMKADGSGQKPLTDNPAADGMVSWSPDGKQLVFTSDRDGVEAVYRMNLDGQEQTAWILDGSNNTSPAWSANRDWILFASDRESAHYEIYKMKLDGSETIRITYGDGNGANNMAPLWQP